MIRLKVPADRITIRSAGASDPMVMTGLGVRREENRRVVIQLVK